MLIEKLKDETLNLSFKEALAGYMKEEFAEALEKFKACHDALLEQELLNPELSHHNDDELLGLKRKIADCSFELGDFNNAHKLYMELKELPQAGYAALFNKELEKSLQVYRLSPFSPASKWGIFISQLFLNEKSIFNPGYLCFRLFFEATCTYIIKFQIKEYLKILEKSVYDLEPVYPEYLKSLGSAYLSNKKYYTAIETFENAKKKHDYDAEIYYKLAQCYMLISDKKRSKRNFDLTLRYLPNHISTLKYLEQLA